MKKYTQIGTISIAVFIPLLLIFIIRLFHSGVSLQWESIGLQVLVLVLLVCLLTFYKLTICIDETTISFTFGIGWFGRSYKFSEIKSCEPVKNPWLAGIGIRWMGNGWLYNVSGLKAIKLIFKHKTSIVRIGTNVPKEICALVREKLSNRTNQSK